MDVREKLVEILGEFLLWPSKIKNVWMPQGIEKLADHLIGNGVTVQEWISVDDRLPEENHDGSVNAVLVTDGFVQHMAYFARGEWRFAESGEIKEPMWYSITHWMPLPEPPKGE